MLEFNFILTWLLRWVGEGSGGWPIYVQDEKAGFYQRLELFDNMADWACDMSGFCLAVRVYVCVCVCANLGALECVNLHAFESSCVHI